MLPPTYEHTPTDDSIDHSKLATMNNPYQTSFAWSNNSIPYETWHPYPTWNPNMCPVGDQFWPATSEPNEWIEPQWQQPLFTQPIDQPIEEAIFQTPPADAPVPPMPRPPPTLERGQTITTGIPKGVDSEFDIAYELNTEMGMRWRRKRPASEAIDEGATESVTQLETWRPQSSQTQHESRNHDYGKEASFQSAPMGDAAIATLGILDKQLQDATRRQLDLVRSQ
ncbi:hypothetical protein FALBO_16487 [Fusarium albosuccineum]|uniref:Uncharacterized protein n=1 Tax=Fusarium albosuccineum TaxID=1237068 RepID=A0A8H4KHB2_9HYPO|nr:hypothetical protein FALBO_16487 [Fusarium albosuccineum]